MQRRDGVETTVMQIGHTLSQSLESQSDSVLHMFHRTHRYVLRRTHVPQNSLFVINKKYMLGHLTKSFLWSLFVDLLPITFSFSSLEYSDKQNQFIGSSNSKIYTNEVDPFVRNFELQLLNTVLL